MLTLPDETLEQIFQYLRYPDIQNCILVNKQFHRVISNNRNVFDKKDVKLKIVSEKEVVRITFSPSADLHDSMHVQFFDMEFIRIHLLCYVEENAERLNREEVESIASKWAHKVASRLDSSMIVSDTTNSMLDSYCSSIYKLPVADRNRAFQSILEGFIEQFRMESLEFENSLPVWALTILLERLNKREAKTSKLRLTAITNLAMVVALEKRIGYDCLQLVRKLGEGVDPRREFFVKLVLQCLDWKNLQTDHLIALDTAQELVEMCCSTTRSNIGFLLITQGHVDWIHELRRYFPQDEHTDDNGTQFSIERPVDNNRLYVKFIWEQYPKITYFKLTDKPIPDNWASWFQCRLR